jgi:hypothetical protein
MSTVISVQLDGVEALAAELAALATSLAGETRLCASAAASLSAALGDDAGWFARAAATGWGSLTGLLAEGSASMATTLSAAVASYRAADLALAGQVDPGLPGHGVVPR